jgi:hypothetical protein
MPPDKASAARTTPACSAGSGRPGPLIATARASACDCRDSPIPVRVEAVDALLRRMAPCHSRHDGDQPADLLRAGVGAVAVASTWWLVAGELARRVHTDLADQRSVVGLLWRMTLAERRAFLDAALLGSDAGRAPGSARFRARHVGDLDVFQVALTVTGQRGDVTARTDGAIGVVRRRAAAGY